MKGYQILIDLRGFVNRNMIYNRSQAIEKRLRDIIDLVSCGRHSTPTLARALKVSEPTVSRCLTALRQRGYLIRPVKDESGWSYEVTAKPRNASFANDGPR
ncbi:MAG: ArsR family transcriptional regulator [Acidobacteriia bacterium]|nr:ArsR family transcriptional regulator [Terriglobia bacterium]